MTSEWLRLKQREARVRAGKGRSGTFRSAFLRAAALRHRPLPSDCPSWGSPSSHSDLTSSLGKHTSEDGGGISFSFHNDFLSVSAKEPPSAPSPSRQSVFLFEGTLDSRFPYSWDLLLAGGCPRLIGWLILCLIQGSKRSSIGDNLGL